MEPVPYMSYKRKLTCPLNSVTKLNDKKLKICCITYNMHGENPTQQEVAQFLKITFFVTFFHKPIDKPFFSDKIKV